MNGAAHPERRGRWRRPDAAAATDPPPRIRILVAENEPLVRAGLTSVLQSQPDMTVVGEASDGGETVEVARCSAPDVVLLDVGLVTANGANAIVSIRAAWPDARVIVLTPGHWDEAAYRAFKAGARACIAKGLPLVAVLETIRAVHAGRTCIPAEAAAQLAERVSLRDLTPRELAILPLLAAGKSNKEIGVALGISAGTIKVHVAHILGKLQASGRTQAVTIALKRGLVDLPRAG